MYRLFNNIDKRFYSPDDPISTPAELNFRGILDELGKDDKEDILTEDKEDDDDGKEAPKVKGDKSKASKDDIEDEPEEDEDSDDETDDEDDELEDILEEEIKEPNEEQLELMTPARRKDILKAYPDLFKKFPYLERAYYREQKYTQLFPTLDDATQAVEAVGTLKNFETDLLAGKTEKIFTIIKGHDPELFAQVVDDYLPTLQRVDEKSYYHVIGNVVRSVVASMITNGNKSGNESLKAGAELLNEYMFGPGDIQAPTNLSKGDKKDKPEDTVAKREKEFNDRRMTSTKNEVTSKVDNSIKSTIDANIDPKDSMTPFVKKHAINEVLTQTKSLIESDKRFTTIIERMYEAAVKADFSPESVSKIRNAYVSKARTLLPAVIKKARIEALKGSTKGRSKEVELDEEEDSEPIQRVPKKKTGHSTADNRGLKTDKERARAIPAGMSTKDYLMSD